MDDIIESYLDDMKKYVSSYSETLKIRDMYLSIPRQLGNVSSKFQITKINPSSRSKYYESSLDWLLASNMVIECNAIKNLIFHLKCIKIMIFLNFI